MAVSGDVWLASHTVGGGPVGTSTWGLVGVVHGEIVEPSFPHTVAWMGPPVVVHMGDQWITLWT